MAPSPNYPGNQPQYPAQYGQQYPPQYAPPYPYPQKRSMPGWLIGLVIGLVVLFVGGGIGLAVFIAGASDFSDHTQWVTYHAPDGSYQARFPKAPDESTETENTPYGTVVSHTALNINLGGTFEVSRTRFNPDEIEYDLAEVLRGIGEDAFLKLDSQQSTTLNQGGYSARKGTFNNGETIVVVFLTHGCLWTVAVTSATDQFQFFLDNIKLGAAVSN
jgi:hypothetical protein